MKRAFDNFNIGYFRCQKLDYFELTYIVESSLKIVKDIHLEILNTDFLTKFWRNFGHPSTRIIVKSLKIISTSKFCRTLDQSLSRKSILSHYKTIPTINDGYKTIDLIVS